MIKFDKKYLSNVNQCPVCGGPCETIYEMQCYPITELYKKIDENHSNQPDCSDQKLNCCIDCQHLFLGINLPRNYIYENYITETKSSHGAKRALLNFYSFVSSNSACENSDIIDIGANDNTLLEMFIGKNNKLIGIDPNIQADNNSILSLKGYFEDFDLSEFSKEKKVFLCSHTLEHIYDPRHFLKKISNVMSNEDELFLQFPSFELLLRDSRFDQVHHQHINYFSLNSLNRLLIECDLRIVSYNFDSEHYGALMCHIRKGNADHLSRALYTIPKILSSYQVFLSSMQAAQKKISFLNDFYCFGASLMLPILSYYIPSLINSNSIIDANPLKHGLTYVNFEIPIREDIDISYEKSNFVITAISTKAAARQITQYLIDKKVENIIYPLNTI